MHPLAVVSLTDTRYKLALVRFAHPEFDLAQVRTAVFAPNERRGAEAAAQGSRDPRTHWVVLAHLRNKPVVVVCLRAVGRGVVRRGGPSSDHHA